MVMEKLGYQWQDIHRKNLFFAVLDFPGDIGLHSHEESESGLTLQGEGQSK